MVRVVAWQFSKTDTSSPSNIGTFKHRHYSNGHSYGQILNVPMFEHADVRSNIGSRFLNGHCRRICKIILVSFSKFNLLLISLKKSRKVYSFSLEKNSIFHSIHIILGQNVKLFFLLYFHLIEVDF